MPNNDETDLIEDSRTPALAFASQTPALAFASGTPALVHARSHTLALAPATGTIPLEPSGSGDVDGGRPIGMDGSQEVAMVV